MTTIEMTTIEKFLEERYRRLHNPRARTSEAASPWGKTSAWGRKRLAAHLSETYGIEPGTVRELDAGVYRVARDDGPAWVARVFGVARPLHEVEGDAEVLRFLEKHRFPAERCADTNPVSMVEDHHVLVTEFVEGGRPRDDGPTTHELGDLLGRLHSLPVKPGGKGPGRVGGGWHHASMAGGGRRGDVEALRPIIAERVATATANDARKGFEALQRELESVDFCDDLPKALSHIDFGAVNVIATSDGGLVPIDWAGSGLGPRVFSINGLLWSTNSGWLQAFVDGYRQHVTLEPEELDRLGAALTVHELVLDAWVAAIVPDRLPQIVAGIEPRRARCNAVARKACDAFAADRAALAGWRDAPPPPPSDREAQIFTDAVVGKTAAEIEEFAKAVGGMKRLCDMVMERMARRRSPADCQVAFVLGDNMGWVLKAVGGKVTVVRRVAKRAPAIVRMTPEQFLRLTANELDWTTEVTSGRVVIDGDPNQLRALLTLTPRHA